MATATSSAVVVVTSSVAPNSAVSTSTRQVVVTAASVGNPPSTAVSVSSASVVVTAPASSGASAAVSNSSARVTVVSTLPTVSAGNNIKVDAGFPIVLNGTDSPSGSPIASRTWTLDGQIVATTASFTSPSPLDFQNKTRTYTYTVTASNGVSASDTVDVTILAATRRIMVDGIYIPSARRYAYNTGNTGGGTGTGGGGGGVVVVTPSENFEVPVSTSAPSYTAGSSFYPVNPDRTTL